MYNGAKGRERMKMDQRLVLFDGECNLCDRLVQFTITRDRRGVIRYAALQSDAGQKLLREHSLSDTDMDTFVFIEDGKAYVRSGAALRLVRHFGGWWPALSVLLAVPRPLRDFLYRIVAQNRYRWFGKKPQCMLMKPEYRDRFLS